MKKSFIALFLCIFVCANSQTNNASVTSLLEGIITFEGVEINEYNPIITVSELAPLQADESVILTVSNIGEVFNKARDFSHCVIVVDQHTVVVVKDWDNCIESGSWEECMPYGEGIVKINELKHFTDYINNIIGIPYDEVRTVYLFD